MPTRWIRFTTRSAIIATRCGIACRFTTPSEARKWSIGSALAPDLRLKRRSLHHERSEKRRLRWRESAAEEHAIVALLLALHVADFVQPRDDIVTFMRHQQLNGLVRLGNQLEAAVLQRIETDLRFCAVE